MRLILIFWLVLFYSTGFANSKVSKKPAPQWVKIINTLDKEIVDGGGAYQYLLIDNQENLIQQSVYRHYAVKVLTPEGVQEMSDISVNFDPAYQKLYFHEIRIIRGEKVINKLRRSEINTFQRETSMERSLYDGSLSAVVNLKDVRENDIIAYSYTIVGFNPVNDGDYSTSFYHQFSSPVNRVFTRVITGSEEKLHYKLYEGAAEPEIIASNGRIELIWDIAALEYKLLENNVPSWFDPYKRVSMSTFERWKDVVDWGVPLYGYSKNEITEIKESINGSYSEEGKILSLIRLVQDDVRYLGFESGIGAYKPHSPLKVFNQRYGDCKDKSLLLVALLRSEGISAYPLLVNTMLKGEVKNQPPSNTIFDHCVVNFIYEGKDYFIDPTIPNQGGSLENIYFPDYQTGLLLKPGNSKLLTIPDKGKATVSIKELIAVDSIGGDAGLIVRSEYTGSKADYMRGYFNTNSTEAIQQEYLNYYSSLYAGIIPSDEIKYYDYDRNTSNKFIVEEFYKITDFWLESDDGSFLYCELYPLVLESQIGYVMTAARKMPYNMGAPYSFVQNTQLDLPEEWTIQDSETVIEGEGFSYENEVRGYGKTVSVSHKYDLTKESIAAELAGPMLKEHKDIQNQLSYYITYNPGLASFQLSWISVFLAAMAVGAGIYFYRKIYYNYNPEPWIYAENKPIGSWLILPAIGLTLTPIVLGMQIFSAEFFNQNTWTGIFSSDAENSWDRALLVGGEIVYNFLFFTFAIFVLIMFYQRRTSVPRLISIYYLVSFLGPVVDMLLVEAFGGGLFTTENSTRAILNGVVSAAIWIPYFNISERAKSTFCKRPR